MLKFFCPVKQNPLFQEDNRFDSLIKSALYSLFLPSIPLSNPASVSKMFSNNVMKSVMICSVAQTHGISKQVYESLK